MRPADGSGALGSGLAIFTRFPLISAQALPYSLSGSPAQAFAGDFFVKKAAGNVVILHPLLGEVEIWTNHVGGILDPLTPDACRWGTPARHQTSAPNRTELAAGEQYPRRCSQGTVYHLRKSDLDPADGRWAISTRSHIPSPLPFCARTLDSQIHTTKSTPSATTINLPIRPHRKRWSDTA